MTLQNKPHAPKPFVQIGVWIDHDKARLVQLQAGEVGISEIHSEVERKHHATGGTQVPGRAYMQSSGSSEYGQETKREEHLRQYYKGLAESLKGADQIYILGPAQAKDELAKELAAHPGLAPRVLGVETMAKASDPQLIAKVKECFHQGGRVRD